MSKEPISPQLKNVPTEAQPILEEEIRHRAYELYEEHGRQHGHDLDDWIRAEAEVTGRAVRTSAS